MTNNATPTIKGVECGYKNIFFQGSYADMLTCRHRYRLGSTRNAISRAKSIDICIMYAAGLNLIDLKLFFVALHTRYSNPNDPSLLLPFVQMMLSVQLLTFKSHREVLIQMPDESGFWSIEK